MFILFQDYDSTYVLSLLQTLAPTFKKTHSPSLVLRDV